MLTLQAMRNHCLGIEGEFVKVAQDSQALAWWKKQRTAGQFGR